MLYLQHAIELRVYELVGSAAFSATILLIVQGAYDTTLVEDGLSRSVENGFFWYPQQGICV